MNRPRGSCDYCGEIRKLQLILQLCDCDYVRTCTWVLLVTTLWNYFRRPFCLLSDVHRLVENIYNISLLSATYTLLLLLMSLRNMSYRVTLAPCYERDPLERNSQAPPSVGWFLMVIKLSWRILKFELHYLSHPFWVSCGFLSRTQGDAKQQLGLCWTHWLVRTVRGHTSWSTW